MIDTINYPIFMQKIYEYVVTNHTPMHIQLESNIFAFPNKEQLLIEAGQENIEDLPGFTDSNALLQYLIQ